MISLRSRPTAFTPAVDRDRLSRECAEATMADCDEGLLLAAAVEEWAQRIASHRYTSEAVRAEALDLARWLPRRVHMIQEAAAKARDEGGRR